VANGFIDQSTGNLYDPSAYPKHGTGIFLVGLEQNGMIYAYAFDLNGNGFTRLATIASGNIRIMYDDPDDRHAIRQGTIPCGAYLTP